MGPIVLDKHVNFRDPILNGCWEIQPEAVGGGICDSLFAITNFRPEVDNDIVSGVAVDNHNVDVAVKFGNSR